mmetsp:Transcript_40690/g.103554  ORF Transcript_40690/g.103554 Transcript_40690/m.103554 type:complete len:220 (+) Transcript_40690:143-802(+)
MCGRRIYRGTHAVGLHLENELANALLFQLQRKRNGLLKCSLFPTHLRLDALLVLPHRRLQSLPQLRVLLLLPQVPVVASAPSHPLRNRRVHDGIREELHCVWELRQVGHVVRVVRDDLGIQVGAVSDHHGLEAQEIVHGEQLLDQGAVHLLVLLEAGRAEVVELLRRNRHLREMRLKQVDNELLEVVVTFSMSEGKFLHLLPHFAALILEGRDGQNPSR